VPRERLDVDDGSGGLDAKRPVHLEDRALSERLSDLVVLLLIFDDSHDPYQRAALMSHPPGLSRHMNLILLAALVVIVALPISEEDVEDFHGGWA